MTEKLSSQFTKKVWQRLRDSNVPIVSKEKYSRRAEISHSLNDALEQKLYLPSVIHGYIGIQKGFGVTRFLPILTAEGMAVYYYLCYSLAPSILKKRQRIYGAWHMVPNITKSEENKAIMFGQGYGNDPFSSAWWLKEWKQFTALLFEATNDRKIGNFVATTDIANFYDSIEIPRLISKLRQTSLDHNEIIDALNAFLSTWNRKHIGYMPSTKGIPQEVISDASRVLSHFYLQDFDEEFDRYCVRRGLTYIRWADDMLVFGSSKQKLESATHFMSRLLRDLGLNLNASKTKFMNKSELREYRALDFLDSLSAGDHKSIDRIIPIILKRHRAGNDLRIDTVFKSMIGYLSKHPGAQNTRNLAFIQDIGWSNRDLLHSLNAGQMLRFIQLNDEPIEAYRKLLMDICKADFGAPRATFLHMLRKHRSQLASRTIGMTHAKAIRSIAYIGKNSEESGVIADFCIPEALNAYR